MNSTVDIKCGDLDGDGDLDAIVQNHGGIGAPENNEVFFNTGGVFTNSGQALGNRNVRLDIADLDGDGDLDTCFAAQGSIPATPVANELWFNDGMGFFTDSGQRLGTLPSTGVDLGDLDDDGDVDAFVVNRENTLQIGQPDQVWLNDGNGSFANSGQNLGALVSTAVALGDVDGDRDLDAVVGTFRSVPNKVWLNDGSGQFMDSGQALGSFSTRDIKRGDIDGDGTLDVFSVDLQFPGDSSHIYLNDGTGIFTLGLTLPAQPNIRGDMGDLDADGDLDFVLAIDLGLSSDTAQADTVWINNDKSCRLCGDCDMDGEWMFWTPCVLPKPL